jgi:amino acid permease
MAVLIFFAVLFTLLGIATAFLVLMASGMASSPSGWRQVLRDLWPSWVLLALAALCWVSWAKA